MPSDVAEDAHDRRERLSAKEWTKIILEVGAIQLPSCPGTNACDGTVPSTSPTFLR